MAECLTRLTDTNHADPVRDLTAWKAGHVILVEEDGHAWRPGEDIRAWVAAGNPVDSWHGNTGLILIPGVPADDVRYLMQSLYDAISLETLLVRRRNWKCDLDLIPTPLRNQLFREYVLEVTQAQFNAAVQYLGV